MVGVWPLVGKILGFTQVSLEDRSRAGAGGGEGERGKLVTASYQEGLYVSQWGLRRLFIKMKIGSRLHILSLVRTTPAL